MENILDWLGELLLNIYKAFVDAIAVVLPSTPDAYQLGTLITNVYTSDNFFNYFLFKCAEVVFVIVGLVVVYKFIKILPLT